MGATVRNGVEFAKAVASPRVPTEQLDLKIYSDTFAMITSVITGDTIRMGTIPFGHKLVYFLVEHADVGSTLDVAFGTTGDVNAYLTTFDMAAGTGILTPADATGAWREAQTADETLQLFIDLAGGITAGAMIRVFAISVKAI